MMCSFDQRKKQLSSRRNQYRFSLTRNKKKSHRKDMQHSCESRIACFIPGEEKEENFSSFLLFLSTFLFYIFLLHFFVVKTIRVCQIAFIFFAYRLCERFSLHSQTTRAARVQNAHKNNSIISVGYFLLVRVFLCSFAFITVHNSYIYFVVWTTGESRCSLFKGTSLFLFLSITFLFFCFFFVAKFSNNKIPAFSFHSTCVTLKNISL